MGFFPMSKRVFATATLVALVVVLAVWLWPSSPSRETIQKTPAPRVPASVPRKLDQVLPAPTPHKAMIRIPDSSTPPAATGRLQDEFLSRYRMSGTSGRIRVSDGRFELLNLRAITKNRYQRDMGPVVTEKLGYVIYASHRPPEVEDGDGSLLVVAKKSNGMLGIVTGTIIVRLKEAALALSLADSYQLQLKYIDDDLRIAYYSAGEGTRATLAQLVELLSQDEAVETVNLEIVNSKKRL